MSERQGSFGLQPQDGSVGFLQHKNYEVVKPRILHPEHPCDAASEKLPELVPGAQSPSTGGGPPERPFPGSIHPQHIS